MLDALTRLDPDDFDLDADLALRPSRCDIATGGLAIPVPVDDVPVDDDTDTDPEPDPDAAPPSRARPGKAKPARRKGEPLDPERVAAAKVGLPYFARMNWMCCQLLDKGDKPTRGHVRLRRAP